MWFLFQQNGVKPEVSAILLWMDMQERNDGRSLKRIRVIAQKNIKPSGDL